METDRIRTAIMQRATELDCAEEVSGMSNIQAVRYIQRKEGHTPCYARDVPLTYAGYYPSGFCGVSECSWKFSCDDYRFPNPLGYGKGRATREDIIEQADRHNCVQDIMNLSDIDAIRFIQRKGGYNPCYARENPLYPSEQNPGNCEQRDCYWIQPCDSYRNKAVIPIDKELSTESHIAIEMLRVRIKDFQTSLNKPSSKMVGLHIRTFQNIFSASRKMLIASPQTVVGESTEDTSSLKRYLFEDNSKMAYGDSSGNTFEYALDVLFTHDIAQLNQWLSETQPFIESGNLAYYPIIKRFAHTKFVGKGGDFPGAIPSFWTLSQSLELDSFHAPHLGVPDGDIMLTHSEFAPILNIDLPVLENLDFRALSKLMSDFPDEVCSFRDFLQSKVEEMRQAVVGSEEFVRDCRRIEREIREHLRKLDSDYKKAKLKTAFSLTGTAVAGWTLAIYCFLQGTGDVLTILGPGGLAYTASAAYSDYITKRLDLKDDPVYFLWLLGKTKRRV